MTEAQHASLPRDERRRRTEAAILDAARQLFAESGFERATIRAVASRASVDPALVMQYFGSKEGLFAAAAKWSGEHETVLTASKEQVPAAALRDMLEKFEGAGDREILHRGVLGPGRQGGHEKGRAGHGSE